MAVTRFSRFIPSDGRSVELFSFLNSLVPHILISKGCQSCEVLRNQEMNEFIVIEKWDKLESHINFIKTSPKKDMYMATHLLGATPESQYFY